jgi:hypothetical protein
MLQHTPTTATRQSYRRTCPLASGHRRGAHAISLVAISGSKNHQTQTTVTSNGQQYSRRGRRGEACCSRGAHKQLRNRTPGGISSALVPPPLLPRCPHHHPRGAAAVARHSLVPQSCTRHTHHRHCCHSRRRCTVIAGAVSQTIAATDVFTRPCAAAAVVPTCRVPPSLLTAAAVATTCWIPPPLRPLPRCQVRSYDLVPLSLPDRSAPGSPPSPPPAPVASPHGCADTAIHDHTGGSGSPRGAKK